MKIKKYDSFLNEDKSWKTIQQQEIKKLIKTVNKKGILSFQTARGEAWKLAVTYNSKTEIYALKYVNGGFEAKLEMGDLFMISTVKMDKDEEVLIHAENLVSKK